MLYNKRRYKIIEGRLHKRWDSMDGDGWMKTKAEAWDAVKPKAEMPRRRGRPRKVVE